MQACGNLYCRADLRARDGVYLVDEDGEVIAHTSVDAHTGKLRDGGDLIAAGIAWGAYCVACQQRIALGD